MTDHDLRQRFDSAKTVMDLESGSAAHIKTNAIRRTQRARVLSAAAAVAVVALAGMFAIRALPGSDQEQELVVTNPSIETPTPGLPVASSVIFETDFSQDTGYDVGFTNLWNSGAVPPTGWDGVRVEGPDAGFAVISGEGVNESNALRISWGDGTQPALSLGKHLTGDETTGYDELYIRYHVRLPNNFVAGTADAEGLGLGSWAWGRLWQNTSIDNLGPNQWTENRTNSGAVRWAFANEVPFTFMTATWTDTVDPDADFRSSTGPRQRLDWFVSSAEPSTQPGYFERIWDLNTTDRPGQLENNTDQRWHTIEYHVRLASSPTAADGVFEIFFDGESQGSWTSVRAFDGAPDRAGPSTTNLGSGFNFLMFFDHVQGWNAQWADPDVGGFLWVNDVVISTKRIGPDYLPE